MDRSAQDYKGQVMEKILEIKILDDKNKVTTLKVEPPYCISMSKGLTGIPSIGTAWPSCESNGRKIILIVQANTQPEAEAIQNNLKDIIESIINC